MFTALGLAMQVGAAYLIYLIWGSHYPIFGDAVLTLLVLVFSVPLGIATISLDWD